MITYDETEKFHVEFTFCFKICGIRVIMLDTERVSWHIL